MQILINKIQVAKVIDEIFTPDSSRFIVDNIKMDKDLLRKWARQNEDFILSHPAGRDGCRDVKLPDEISGRLIANYREFYARLDSLDRLSPVSELQLATLNQSAVIIAGSKSDSSHVEKIRAELYKKDILSFVYFCSAHKSPKRLLEILAEYESNKTSKIVYVAVAGMASALGAVMAANCTKPVISCPPFTDKTDFSVNINSLLQLPSSVPSATILNPENTAIFCSRILNL